MSDIAERGHPGPASSILKSRGSELKQQLDGLTVSALGYYTSPQQMKLEFQVQILMYRTCYGITAFQLGPNNGLLPFMVDLMKSKEI